MKTSGRLHRPLPETHHAAMMRASIVAYVIAGVCAAAGMTLLGAAWSTLLLG